MKDVIVEYSSQSKNITDSQPLLAPQHQQCSLSIKFSDNVGHSNPLIYFK